MGVRFCLNPRIFLFYLLVFGREAVTTFRTPTGYDLQLVQLLVFNLDHLFELVNLVD